MCRSGSGLIWLHSLFRFIHMFTEETRTQTNTKETACRVCLDFQWWHCKFQNTCQGHYWPQPQREADFYLKQVYWSFFLIVPVFQAYLIFREKLLCFPICSHLFPHSFNKNAVHWQMTSSLFSFILCLVLGSCQWNSTLPEQLFHI